MPLRQVKAKARHTCIECGGFIYSGDLYLYEGGRVEVTKNDLFICWAYWHVKKHQNCQQSNLFTNGKD